VSSTSPSSASAPRRPTSWGSSARSDVVSENFKAGTLEEKFGIGYRQFREVHPRLIYVANTGFGQWGPFSRGRASTDGPIARALSDPSRDFVDAKR